MAERGAGQDPYEDSKQEPQDGKFTIESMFMVFDKDAGTYVDLREIMDFPEEEYKENK